MCAFFLPLINACSSSQDQLPTWVENPQADNIQFIYGIGEGMNLDGAKQSALKNIASRFSIKVASNTSNRQTLHNGRNDQLFQQNINTSIDDVELTQFKLLKTENSNNLYYVLLSISRSEFILDKQTKLQTLIDDINLELKDIDQKNKVDQLYRYNKVLVSILKAEPLIHLLTVADKRFSSKKYTAKFNQYIEREKQLLANTRFFVRSTKKLDVISSLIKNALETHGFQLASNFHADGIIDITGTIKNTTNFSTKNTRIDFNVFVKSPLGRLYKKTSYRLNGSSVSSYQSAQEVATRKFAQQITNKLDVYKMFGFN